MDSGETQGFKASLKPLESSLTSPKKVSFSSSFFGYFPSFCFIMLTYTHYWGQEMIFHFCPPRFCACISKGKNMFSIHYFVNALQNFSFSAFVITRFLKIGCSVQLVRNLASFWGIDFNDRSNLSGSCNVWQVFALWQIFGVHLRKNKGAFIKKKWSAKINTRSEICCFEKFSCM